MTDIPYRLFMGALIFSPIAFGSVETWSLAVMEFCCLISLFLFYRDRAKKENTMVLEIPGLIPLILFLSFMIIQIVPLPALLLKLLSPAADAVYRETSLDGNAGWTSLSINRKAAVSEFFRYAAYAATYILTIQFLSHKERVKKSLAIVLLLAVTIAFFGTLQHLIPNKKIFWIRELTSGGSPFGPFVNRNHYAGFMGMLFPIAFSLFLFYRPVLQPEPLRQKLVNFFNHPITNIHAFLGFASVLMATSIFLSLSRGGIASLTMALVLLGLLLNRKIRQSRMRLLFIVGIVVIFYAVGWFGWGPVFERFRSIRSAQGEIAELRLDLWRDSLAIIKDFPLFGTGFGTFIHIYTTYRYITSDAVADHAHNDYIELLTSGGLAGALLFSWFVASVIIRSYRTFLTRRDSFSIHLFAGSFAGISALLLHSLTDFNLQIGSNGLFFFFLLGLMAAASHLRTGDEQGGTLLKGVSVPLMSFATAACIMAFFSLAYNSGQMLSKFYATEVQSVRAVSSSSENVHFLRGNLKKAIFFDPLEADYHYRLAGIEFLVNKGDSLSHSRETVRLNPVKAEYLQSLGMALAEEGRTSDAEKLLRLGTVRDRTNPAVYRRYASWLKMQERGDEGLSYFRQALLLEPNKIREYITSLALLGYADDDIKTILPEETRAYLTFGDYLAKAGRDAAASGIYVEAIALAEQEKLPETTAFFRAHDFFLNKGRNKEAMLALERAVTCMPDSVQARIRYAEAFDRAGLKERARAEYEKTLQLDPRNAPARKRLNELR